MTRQNASKRAIRDLCEFCSRFDHVTVRLRHVELHPNGYSTHRNGFSLKIYLRNDFNFIKRILNDTNEQTTDERTSYLVDNLKNILVTMRDRDRKVFPANLHVYPPFTKFDEQNFIDPFDLGREAWGECTELPAGLNEHLALIKEIFEHGI